MREKITLGSESCDRLGDIIICNFDPATNERFSSSEQFHYGYFNGEFYRKEDFSLSKLEKFDWFEILEFADMKNDDISILLDFPQLKEVRCKRDFSRKQNRNFFAPRIFSCLSKKLFHCQFHFFRKTLVILPEILYNEKV